MCIIEISAEFQYDFSMTSSKNRKAAIKKLKYLYLPVKSDLKAFRNKMDEVFSTPFIPSKVELTERDYGGILCDVLNPEIYNSRKIVLYIHGGCFTGGSRKSCRNFAAVLANSVNCRVVVPEFRLAPAHPFPSSLEDLQTVFRNIFMEEQIALSLEDGFNSKNQCVPNIIVMASTSGASLALGLIQTISENKLKSIKNIFLFSPWLDLSDNSFIFSQKKLSDELTSKEAVRRAVEFYTFHDNVSSPLVSPAKIPPHILKKFPAIFIQSGENEIMLEDTKRFQKLVEDAGGECIIDIWPKMMGMFQLMDDFLDESHLAVEKIGNFLNQRKITVFDSQEKIQLKLETKDDFIKHQ